VPRRRSQSPPAQSGLAHAHGATRDPTLRRRALWQPARYRPCPDR
jgi:hypothetical protein